MHADVSLPLRAGIGLKPAHYAGLLDLDDPRRPGWLEVHPQNYFVDGGPPHRWLTELAAHYPLSFHSVGLSLGSADGLIGDELEALATLAARYQPTAISDHLSWSGHGDQRYPDLLPVPYSHAALTHFAAQIGRVQDRLGRAILIENPSRYMALTGDDMDEVDFLHALCRRAGCGLLFDINNVAVSAHNLGLDPLRWIDGIDPALVGEIHLAGHAQDDDFLIDDHGSPVSDQVWLWLNRFLARSGPRPVLIEWDTDVPPLETLLAEAARAQAALDA